MGQSVEEMFPLKEEYIFRIRNFDEKVNNVIKNLPCVRQR